MEDVKKSEHPLQAVVLVDSFEKTFRPITLDTPKALMPLANVPLIEYTLEFLAEAQVKEIFLFCGWLAELVEAYIAKSRWNKSKDITIQILKSPDVNNSCGAIRALDNMQKLKSEPFIIVSGDVVSNVNLKPILQAHKERRKKENGGDNNVMTMVLSPVDQKNNNIQSLPDELIVALDAETNQVLKYDNAVGSNTVRSKDADLFDDFPSIVYRSDLIDCHIDICSQGMVNQIVENYDFKDLRKDYIHKEVENREFGFCFHAHVMSSPSEYACRVRCPRTYDAISRDVMRRWLYPLVPDANWVSESTSYVFERGFRYKDSNVKIARSSVIGEDTMLGDGVVVAEGAKVINSILGPGCQIGKNAEIINSHIWSNVIIESNAKVESAILCDDVVVKEGATISRGCVLGNRVEVGAGFKTEPFARFTTIKAQVEAEENDEESDFGFSSDDEDDNNNTNNSTNNSNNLTSPKRRGTSTDTSITTDESAVGAGGFGQRWMKSTSTIGRVLNVPKWAETAFKKEIENCDPNITFEEVSTSIGCTHLENARSAVYNDLGPLVLEDDDESVDVFSAVRSPQKLLLDVAGLLGEYLNAEASDDVPHKPVQVELNTFKFADNWQFDDLIYAIVPVVFGDAIESCENSKQVKEVVKSKFEIWGETMEYLCVREPQERSLIQAVEILCLYGQQTAGFAGLALHGGTFDAADYDLLKGEQAYDLARQSFPMILTDLVVGELVSREAVVAWSENHDASGLPNEILKSQIMQLVLAQLVEEDSDSGSDDDDDDDDDDSDEDSD